LRVECPGLRGGARGVIGLSVDFCEMSDVNLLGVVSVSSKESWVKYRESLWLLVTGGEGFCFRARALWNSAVRAGTEAVTMAKKCSIWAARAMIGKFQPMSKERQALGW